MMIKRNSTIFGKHHLSRTIIAALFSVTLIFGMGGVSLPLQPQQEVYASSQMQRCITLRIKKIYPLVAHYFLLYHKSL